MTDRVRRQAPFLAAVKRGDRDECVVGRGRFKRVIMSVDILEWGEEQTPPWTLQRITSSTENNTEWSYMYLHQERMENVPEAPPEAEDTEERPLKRSHED